MKSRVVVVALALAVPFGGCGCPAEVVDEPAERGGPALLFAPLPDAFRLPDDDVDPEAEGLQVEVRVNVENQTDDAAIDSVTLVSAGGVSDTADIEDDGDGNGHALVQATLAVAAAPVGADNVLVATGGGLEVRRSIVGLDRTTPPVPPPPACDLDVASDGDAVVTCAGGDPDSSAVQNLVRGGLVSLRTRPSADDANFRVQIQELRGGRATFPFAFDDDGNYSFTVVLVDGAAVVGDPVGDSVVVDVDVP